MYTYIWGAHYPARTPFVSSQNPLSSPPEGRLDANGEAVIVSDTPATPVARKDSLALLIGAGPLGSKALDAVESIEEAMRTK